ncbi:MAG: tyrosine-type recombinase/integrase, partial [Atopobiaceae bacterium]|nr:tyrosine-type recombinase/integrase [Atopobiaceae bacterium]
MPLTEFEGPYAGMLYEYVAFRSALGFVVPASTRRTLHHMADYLYTLPLIPEVIDRERADEISAAREGESERTRQSRFVVLRQLCLWLRRTGVGAYVPPPGQVRARNDFVPRIVSEDEMARIIGVAESGTLPWVPMVLKILWCTGLRIGEATALRVGDLRLSELAMYVAHAKNDRSRIIPISATLASAAEDYLGAHAHDTRPEAWLFPGKEPGRHR